jgi:hypothetical protein
VFDRSERLFHYSEYRLTAFSSSSLSAASTAGFHAVQFPHRRIAQIARFSISGFFPLDPSPGAPHLFFKERLLYTHFALAERVSVDAQDASG